MTTLVHTYHCLPSFVITCIAWVNMYSMLFISYSWAKKELLSSLFAYTHHIPGLLLYCYILLLLILHVTVRAPLLMIYRKYSTLYGWGLVSNIAHGFTWCCIYHLTLTLILSCYITHNSALTCTYGNTNAS